MKYSILVLAALLAACSSHPEGARLDPALRLLVPVETTMLGAIQVEELLKSDFYKKHLADRALPQIDEFAAQTGVDVNNLWEVMLISDGERGVSIARGKFSQGEAEPRLPERGGKRFNYKGYTLVGDEESAVLLMGPTVAGIGNTALLRRVVDARGESNGPRGVIEERMKQVPYEAEAWAVFSGSLAGRIPIPQGKDGKNTTVLAQAANSIQSGALYFDLGTLLTLDVALHADAEANAKQLKSSLNGLLGLGKLMAPNFQKAFDSVQLTQTSNTVHLRAQTTEDTLVPLFDLLEQ